MTHVSFFIMFNACYILFYPFHVSEKSKGNKRKKTTKQIDEEEDEDLKNIESGYTIN